MVNSPVWGATGECRILRLIVDWRLTRVRLHQAELTGKLPVPCVYHNCYSSYHFPCEFWLRMARPFFTACYWQMFIL